MHKTISNFKVTSFVIIYKFTSYTTTIKHTILSATNIVRFIVVVYDVNLYIIIIVTQRGGFRKVTSFGICPGHHQIYALFKHTKKPYSRP